MIFSSASRDNFTLELPCITPVGTIREHIEDYITTDSLRTYHQFCTFLKSDMQYKEINELFRNNYNELTEVVIILWRDSDNQHNFVLLNVNDDRKQFINMVKLELELLAEAE